MQSTEATIDEADREYAAAAEAGMRRDDNAAYVALDALGPQLLAEFTQAELARRETETRWLKDLRQYRGVYDPDVAAKIGPHRSKAFVRNTRVKVKTVDARVTDLLFPSNSDRNWIAEATPLASLDEETEQTVFRALVQNLGRKPTRMELDQAIRKLAEKAAQAMTRVIDDQLAEARYKEVARQVLHSGHLYGTGVLKAPLVERRTRIKYVRVKGKWVMRTQVYVAPFVDYVPLWRFYPDMNATCLEDCRYVYECHQMTRAALAKLARSRAFDGAKIRDFINANPTGMRTERQYQGELRQIGERQSTNLKDDHQYEVLERWGWLDGEQLAAIGVDVPQHRLHETFFSNVWLLPDGNVIKAVLQPINGVTWPYHLYYADKDETSIFGDGFAAIMRDDQTMINAGTRMILDNAALTAGPQLEVNMKLLSPSERADDMFPFKIWRRTGEDAGTPAIRVIDIKSGLEELFPIVNMFKENADDVTAIPRYMQGENATSGAAGTASGMSMLMANASIVLKDLITSYDEGITRSFIESLYRWNMQFNPDNDIKGDFDIKARGTASLMAKEVRAQRLDQFAATISPEDAPYIKREELLRQRAEAHDLTSIIKSEEEVEAERNSEAARKQAELDQQMQAIQMQTQQLAVKKLEAEVARAMADVARLQAMATKTNVDAAYAGMQAGGVATERPEIAPAGDAILKSAGFVDQTPGQATPAGTGEALPAPESAAVPTAGRDPIGGQVGANAGEHAGIETPAIEA